VPTGSNASTGSTASSASTAKRIAVVTGTRAEFGLLRPVMQAVADHPALSLRVVVAGMHLITPTGRDIRDAGFTADARVPMQKAGRTGRAADVAAIARGVAGFGKAFDKLRPDVVLVLGDRIEPLAAAVAASVGGVRLAHVHGGDRAEGVADEAIRHAVTKLAHVHFPATTTSRRRIIRMGEDPAHVCRVGSPAIDGVKAVRADPAAPDAIVVQHPIGADDEQEGRWFSETWAAVEAAKLKALALAPNADPGGDGIRAVQQQLGLEVIEHMPRPRFLAMLKGARVIVGNSSAGLIEAAALRTACVNVGPRQAGREAPSHVVACGYGRSAVAEAIRAARRLDLTRFRHPYGRGDTGMQIAARLAALDLGDIPVRKRNTY